MDVLRVRWWDDDGPAADPAAVQAVSVVGVRGESNREAARHAVRVALVAGLQAWRGVDAAAIRLGGDAGEAPYALIDAAGTTERIHLAISHDGELSVAAWSATAAVGIDVMAVAEFPDWDAVALDYLGPASTAALLALPESAHSAAFARAWSEREARLKCRGLPLSEWNELSDADEAQLAACTCAALLLPDGYVGVLALAHG
jgi:4'-phosphopantetheinyl transferase